MVRRIWMERHLGLVWDLGAERLERNLSLVRRLRIQRMVRRVWPEWLVWYFGLVWYFRNQRLERDVRMVWGIGTERLERSVGLVWNVGTERLERHLFVVRIERVLSHSRRAWLKRLVWG